MRLLAFSYFCFNYVFYLIGTWSFRYIVQARDFTGLESGFAGMLPWIGAGIGAGIGGYLSDGFALMATFFMVELNEGAYWAATMRVARADTGAATGVLNTGGNFAGIVSAPIIGALSGAGNWNLTFMIGTGFAFVAAVCWLMIDPDRRVQAACSTRALASA